MKKIRLLAILLAILMIPFGMFFACDKDDDVDDGDDDEVAGDDGDDDTSGPKKPVVYDDDGANADGGYLMYFHFNAAGNGMLNIVPASTDTTKPESEYELEPPYSNYLEGTLVNGGTYTVRTDGDRKFLAMERRDTSTSPTLKIKVDEALASDIDADHMIQFELYFEDGMFGSPVDFYGTKNAAKNKFNFLTIENGAIKDANGTTVYGDKSTDKKGWITVSILVAEQSRTYDIYVDGIKQTNGTEFPDETTYPKWTNYKPFTYYFAIRNAGSVNTYCYLDNLCMKNGNEATLGIYKGEDTIGVHYARVPSYKDLATPTKDHVLSLYPAAGIAKMKNTPFSSSLLMSNTLTVSKITTPEEGAYVIEDVMTDYGAETGAYTNGNVSILYKGNEYFEVWTELDYDNDEYSDSNALSINRVVYDADKTDAEAGVAGTYAVTDGVITFDWGENTVPQAGGADLKYAKYAGDTLSFYTDSACATKVEGAEYALYKAAEGYAYATYANIGEGDKYTLTVDPFFGTALLKVVPVEGDTVEDEYAYAVDGNALTVDSYIFTYNEENNTFTVGDVVLNKVVNEIALGKDDKLAIKHTNFKTGVSAGLSWAVDGKWWYDTGRYEYPTFTFEFYATQELVDSGMQFLLQFDFGTSMTPESDGKTYKSAYYSMAFDSDLASYDNKGTYKYVQGWNKYEVVITDTAINRTPNLENFKSVKLVVTGWSNGPTGDNDGIDGNGDGDFNGKAAEGDTMPCDVPNDGITLYISRLAFTKNTQLELKGPDLGKERCEHEDDLGEDLYEKVAEPIPGNCLHGEYYIEKCSNCGATRLDTDKPVGDPDEHVLGTEQKYLAPTCTEQGYYYLECEDCGYHAIQETVSEKGHNYNIDADWTNKKVTYRCIICGEERQETIFDSLIPMSSKINDYKDTVNFIAGTYCDGTTNTNLDQKDTTGDGSFGVEDIVGDVKGPVRCATVKSAFAGGRNALEITHIAPTKAEASRHTYWSISWTAAENFDAVVEAEVMLGKKKADGTYITQWVTFTERTLKGADGKVKSRDYDIFKVDNKGVGKLHSVVGTPKELQLSDSKFTNIAICYSSTKNTVALYVDGYKYDELPFKTGNFATAGVAQPGEMRWNLENVAGTDGGSTYFSGICMYTGDMPICVITDLQMNEEATGDVVLKDEDGFDMLDSFKVDAIDVNTYLGVDVYTSKYVFEFNLNGTDLADGTLLQGVKRGTGYDRFEALLSVKDGNLYFGDRLISETTENVKIGFEVDDTVGSVTIYVNGVALDGTESYTNAAYAEFGAYIRALCFMNDCGSYDVSGLKMYTGAYVAA